jgi:peptidoglycan/LPS O-acetylase OafA/YrhL
MDRNRYVDLLRVLAIGGVVYGHWLLVSLTYRRGRLSGVNAIGYVSWAPWVTWTFQVMPVFFLVGGYVNARSWPSHRARGETWTVWVRDRALRLLWPTAVFVAAGALAVSAAGVTGAHLHVIGYANYLFVWVRCISGGSPGRTAR